MQRCCCTDSQYVLLTCLFLELCVIYPSFQCDGTALQVPGDLVIKVRGGSTLQGWPKCCKHHLSRQVCKQNDPLLVVKMHC